MGTEAGRSWENSVAEMIQFCHHRAPGRYVRAGSEQALCQQKVHKTLVLGPWLGRSNESSFYAVQTALYLPPNSQQTFFGVATVRMVGMVMQMLAWSREEEIERNERWERGHVYDTKDEPPYSPTNLCPSGKCHSMASHHLKPCSTTHANWSVWPFIIFPWVVFLLRVSQNLDTWAGLWWKLMVLGFSWKATVLIFISIQKQIAQK